MERDPLFSAASFAGGAPSLHNSQPWHWYVGREILELRLEPDRVLPSSDPAARLAVLSCGVALHHARLHLAAAGLVVTVQRVPDVGDPGLLARLHLVATAAPDRDAVRLADAAAVRRTDRRELPGAPVDYHRIHRVRAAVRAQGPELTPLLPLQVLALGRTVELARAAEATHAGRQRELSRWVGVERRTGAGVPAGALPAGPHRVITPAQALRRPGADLVADSREHAAVFTLLHGPAGRRGDWLRAGEGLSAGWLTATALDVALLPLSLVLEGGELPPGLPGGTDQPYLVVRLSTGTPDPLPPTPRLDPEVTVTTVVQRRRLPRG
ncbi:hypothetical protein [Actinoplanes sp. N902-109]|uniref:hypothetical protein n=1 Tax=Actinoplanes sp. (strain N902-109) TaxID=649831 RepID=UPI0003294AF7|nr:hypothetical protein [Actinoplanes sp. N902-109]AGL16943.1 hypothetical protein L083_3433 [Actinoplanes sp. N902-109]